MNVQLQLLRTQRVEESYAVVDARARMVTMGAEMSTMHTSLTQSSERFGAIGQLSDARQMKVRLMTDVLPLQQVAALERDLTTRERRGRHRPADRRRQPRPVDRQTRRVHRQTPGDESRRRQARAAVARSREALRHDHA